MVDGGPNQSGSGGHPVPPGVTYSKVPITTLVIWAIIIALACLFYARQHVATPSNQISQAEFLDKLAANQIASATMFVDQQKLPLVEISGSYLKNNQMTEIPFQVHNFLMSGEAQNSLAHSPKVSFRSPNTTASNLLWGITPFVILCVLFWLCLIRPLKALKKG